MQINIVKNSSEGIKEEKNIQWELANKKNIRLIIIYLLLGVIMLGSIAFLNKNINNENKINDLGVGECLTLLAIINYYSYYRKKREFNSKINNYIKSCNKGLIRIETVINEFGIQINDSINNSSIHNKLTWDCFSSYIFYKNYLFLISDVLSPYLIIIHKEDVSINEFNELYSFIAGRLKERTSLD